MIHEEIVTYEVAKLAREVMLNVPCRHIYTKDGKLKEVCEYKSADDAINDAYACAPTQSLLKRWLRDEKNIHIEIVATNLGYMWIATKTNGTAITDSNILEKGIYSGCYDAYELAVEGALAYILEYLV